MDKREGEVHMCTLQMLALKVGCACAPLNLILLG